MSSKYISFTRDYNLSPGEVLAGLVFGVTGSHQTNTLEHLEKQAVEYGMSMFIMDKITEAHTGFSNFKELLNAKGYYRPTIRCNDTKVYKGDVAVDMTLLADAYDMVQTLRGDDRRVFGRG